jgi:hypothetical protein
MSFLFFDALTEQTATSFLPRIYSILHTRSPVLDDQLVDNLTTLLTLPVTCPSFLCLGSDTRYEICLVVYLVPFFGPESPSLKASLLRVYLRFGADAAKDFRTYFFLLLS